MRLSGILFREEPGMATNDAGRNGGMARWDARVNPVFPTKTRYNPAKQRKAWNYWRYTMFETGISSNST